MATDYDAIVIGARCAGSPTAMLLARKGYRVLLLDKARFPSDTMSTHIVHAPGLAALERWGLLGRLVATRCPHFTRYSVDFGPLRIAGAPRPADGVSGAYAPRRTILDKLLVDAAVEAGAELREGFAVSELLFDGDRVTGIRGRTGGGGPLVTERASIVIGADGRHSLVAKAVGAPAYHERPAIQAGYYAYWSGLDLEGFENFARPGRGFGAAPTHDGLAVVVAGYPHAEFHANRKDIEGTYMSTLALVPDFAERIRRAKRETRFIGTADLPNYYRLPYGDGWALVGDAGYHKDPITAQGISDAFRDAQALTDAIDAGFSGRSPLADALAAYQRERDAASLPIFEFTCALATMEPPPPEMQARLASIAGDQDAMDDFVSVIAGTRSPADVLGPAPAHA
jgi:flavin-dependent dehydrogenase